MKTLATRLKDRRDELGLTQTELAKRAGLKSQSIIGMLESGERKNSSHLPAIAKALGVEVLWLQYEDGVMYRYPYDTNEEQIEAGKRLKDEHDELEAKRSAEPTHFTLDREPGTYESALAALVAVLVREGHPADIEAAPSDLKRALDKALRPHARIEIDTPLPVKKAVGSQ